MCAALVEASPLGANNGDVILKAIVLVYIRHHWIETHPLAGTELPAWCHLGSPRNVLARLGCLENRRFTSPRSYRSVQFLFVLL